MRYRVVACDYDGTLASGGIVEENTVEALQRLRASGRAAVLVTGRELSDLLRIFPHPELFDRIVAENGAVLYTPATRAHRILAEPAPEEFLALLRRKQVQPLSAGRVIVSTTESNEPAVRDAIRSLGLDLHIERNKGAAMVLPAGIDKATGLSAALAELHVSPQEAVAAGDAENDEPFMRMCGCAVGVNNALPQVKKCAAWVTQRDAGAGVVELIDRLLASDR